MLLLAVAGMGASCSNDDLADPHQPTLSGRNEIQLEFTGTGESEEYTKSTIASDSENLIDRLSVYLFAAASEGGPYYYMETWNEGTPYDPANPTTTFKKQASGTAWKASLYPNEVKGLPYLKLMCIVNNGSDATTDGNFYDDSNAQILATMTAVTTNADGTLSNNPTSEAQFTAAMTRHMQNGGGVTDIIRTPLLMTGQGKTKISGSVSKVNINLKRVMARFDIENTTSKSQLTINTITMAQARKNASLWGTTLVQVGDPDLDLMTYAPIDYTNKPNANLGVTESAMYVYPGIGDDESYLIIEGTFKSPVTSQQVPVTYHVPVVKTATAPGSTADYIAIRANSRYKLRITDVTQSNVYGTFEVVDWVSGGGINIKPGSDSPVFTGMDAFTGANMPIRLADGVEEKDTCNYEVDGNAGSFSITIAATGKVRAEKAAVETKAGLDWLTITAQPSVEKENAWYTTFDITYDDAIGQQPVAITFINEAASYDPALWTTLNFFGPKAAPAFTATQNPVISTGNTLDVTNPTAPEATLFKVNGSQVQIDAACVEGIVIGNLPAGLEVLEPRTGSKTYTIRVKDASTATAGTISFKNKGDETKVSNITVNLLEAGMTASIGTDNTNSATLAGDAANGYSLQVDLETLLAGSFTFKVNSPQGLGTPAPSLASDWLTISKTGDWSDTDKFDTYTVSAVSPAPAAFNDVVLNFANIVPGAAGIRVTLTKAPSMPKMSAAASGTPSVFNSTPVIVNSHSATADMYTTNGSKVYIKVACEEGITVDPVNGLSVALEGDEYVIEVTDASLLINATSDIAFKNTNDGSRSAVLTVTWKNPAITLEGVAKVTVSGQTVSTQNDFTQYETARFKIKGYSGSTVTYPNVAGSWLQFNAQPTTIDASGEVTVVIEGTAVSYNNDVTLTVRNAITGQDETITITKAN